MWPVSDENIKCMVQYQYLILDSVYTAQVQLWIHKKVPATDQFPIYTVAANLKHFVTD